MPPTLPGVKGRAAHPSLAEGRPDLAAEWDSLVNDLEPHQVTLGSSRRGVWRCGTCGFRFQAIVSNRTMRGSGCPACSNRQRRVPDPGRALAEVYPALAAEWDNDRNELTPKDVSVGSRTNAWWRCATCDHMWQARVGSRTRRGDGSRCPACAVRARRVPRPGRSLAETHPHLVAELHPSVNPFRADEVSAGSDVAAVWQCPECDHIWSTRVSSRTRTARGTGCPRCSRARRRGRTARRG